MKNEIIKILYQNSSDDSEYLRVKFDKIESVTDEIVSAAYTSMTKDVSTFLNNRIKRLENVVEKNAGNRSIIETKARIRELQYLINMIPE